MISKEEEVKCMIRNGNYEGAKLKIQEGINVYPSIKYGRELITLCEILQLSDESRRYRPRQTWPYTLFQIPSSSTESEVKSRYESLRDHLKSLENYNKIKGTAAAIKEIDLAMSIHRENHRKRRRASSDSDDADEHPYAAGSSKDANKAVAGNGSYDSDDDDPCAAARSPGFMKLRNQVFTALPQQPHFNPLPKYCPSVRQEMKLGFDMIFVKLTQKLQKLGGDQTLSNEEEDTMKGELSNLEEMGYNVMKLRERFDLLVTVKTISKNDECYEDKIKNLDAQIRDETLQLANVQCRISKLKSEKQVVEAQHSSFKSEIAHDANGGR